MGVNILKTIYFNFKMLPFRQALKLPVLLYGKVKIIRTTGRILLNAPVSRGMIKIGAQGSEMFPERVSVIDLSGTLKVEGHSIRIGAGGLLRIEKKGTIILNECCRIGACSILFAETLIEIGYNTGASWCCQIMDTDTHSIKDLTTGKIALRTRPITIGDNCWIGNHVLINKGTVLPNGTIVSSNSLCNKDYTAFMEDIGGAVLGGIPAKLLAVGKERLYDKL